MMPTLSKSSPIRPFHEFKRWIALLIGAVLLISGGLVTFPHRAAAQLALTPSATLPPTWTLVPSLTPAPTRTRFPSSTPRGTNTPIRTATPAGGAVGVLTRDGLITVAISRAEFNSRLALARIEAQNASVIQSDPVAVFLPRQVRVTALVNNFTTTGLLTDFDCLIRGAGNKLVVAVATHRTANGSRLPPSQVLIVAGMMELTANKLFNETLQAAVGSALTEGTRLEIRNVLFEEERLLVTVRITQPVVTATSTDLQPTSAETVLATVTPTASGSATVTVTAPATAQNRALSTNTPAGTP